MRLQWKLISVHLEIILMKDRCTVCAEHNIGLKIVLDTPDVTRISFRFVRR
jgi:hypothetical protein